MYPGGNHNNTLGVAWKLIAIDSKMQHVSKFFSRSSKPLSKSLSSLSSNPDLFEYTSGRFLFNEELRRAERRIQFDVDALARAACDSVGRCLDGVASITKLAEGGFNHVLQITFNDGYAVLARLPYKKTVPRHYAVASEAATLAVLRAHGVPVPKVLAYSPNQTHAVGIGDWDIAAFTPRLQVQKLPYHTPFQATRVFDIRVYVHSKSPRHELVSKQLCVWTLPYGHMPASVLIGANYKIF